MPMASQVCKEKALLQLMLTLVRCRSCSTLREVVLHPWVIVVLRTLQAVQATLLIATTVAAMTLQP